MNIFNIFRKKQKDPPFNIHHPDLADKVEFAFEAGPIFGKRKFYRAKDDYRLPYGRYKYIDAFLYEVELRMDLKKLEQYMDILEKNLDGSKGNISIAKAFEVIWAIRSRCKLAFEPETVKRLASVTYFDETEDLSDFDMEYGAEKVKFWEKHGCYAFFLTSPIEELLNLKGTSETSLQTYIRQAQAVLKDLTLDPEKQSSPNT
jgi:hypothetical protein